MRSFITWHFVQTHLWYDGLAQDVSIFSSQGLVIVLLVWIMLMENQRRGLFFGKKISILQQVIRFARKYHGYFYAWATIYTFWYHPMVSTSGHRIGFVPIKPTARLPMNRHSLCCTYCTLFKAEITALEQRHAKIRLLKQGMMQELLTGRIRLI